MDGGELRSGTRRGETGSTRQQQQQRRSKLGACLKREERWLSPPLCLSSPPARLRLGLRSVTNQEAAKQRPFLLYNILYQSVCLRSDFLFPHFVRERSTQVRRRRADGARTEEGGGRIPSWSSRGVETRVTWGARGQGGHRWEMDRRTRHWACSTSRLISLSEYYLSTSHYSIFLLQNQLISAKF